MTYLAERCKPREYCLLRTIAEEDNLPQHFVGKIFQSLVKAGLLYSAKGRGGGFALQRDPSEIRLIDIVAAIDGTDKLERCVVGFAECNSEQPCPLHDDWKPHRERLQTWMRKTTLADMAACAAAKRSELSELSGAADGESRSSISAQRASGVPLNVDRPAR
jgi:Rrf2 family protein